MDLAIHILLLVLIAVFIVVGIYLFLVLKDIKKTIKESERTLMTLNARLPLLIEDVDETIKTLKVAVKETRGNLSGLGKVVGFLASLVPARAAGSRGMRMGMLYPIGAALLMEIINRFVLKKKTKRGKGERKE